MDDTKSLADRQNLVKVLNMWPELVGLGVTPLQVWLMLFLRMPEWVPGLEISQALYGDETPIWVPILRLRRFLTRTSWRLETQKHHLEKGGSCYRLVEKQTKEGA